jgi:hypothetical protein
MLHPDQNNRYDERVATRSLAGWRRTVVDGGILLVPPDGASALIRVHARLPLRPVRAVLAEYARAGLGGAAAELAAPPRAVSTDESEYAVLAELGVARPELRRFLGIILGDAHMAVIDGRVASAELVPEVGELVERITVTWCLGLGGERWRRFYYHPPPAWAGLERDRADVWLAPTYPLNSGTISVFFARPQQATRAMEQHARMFEKLTAEYGVAGPSPPRPVRARSGLLGEVVTFQTTINGRLRHAGNVGFTDGRHVYLLRLETDDEHRAENIAVFQRVVESVEPLPMPSRDLGGLVHWSE